MTFGSMFAADPDFPATLQLLAESARMAGCRAIIQTNGFAPPSGSPDIYCIARAPHHLLFPACNAIVHHGGSGTTHSASAAGCPSIVVQHATDQAMWGKVLHRAGIAPRALDRRTVTPASLARAIRFVLKSPAMREKARVIGDRMKQKNGVQRAVGHICTRFSLTPDRAKK
jgi:UDP:flavonoid glycosyltransferase YjiC (YdhE family)